VEIQKCHQVVRTEEQQSDADQPLSLFVLKIQLVSDRYRHNNQNSKACICDRVVYPTDEVVDVKSLECRDQEHYKQVEIKGSS
jgi:hypothetical protein